MYLLVLLLLSLNAHAQWQVFSELEDGTWYFLKDELFLNSEGQFIRFKNKNQSIILDDYYYHFFVLYSLRLGL